MANDITPREVRQVPQDSSTPRKPRRGRHELAEVIRDIEVVFDHFTSRTSSVPQAIARGLDLGDPYGILDGRPCDGWKPPEGEQRLVDIKIHRMLKDDSFKVILHPSPGRVLTAEEYSVEKTKVVEAEVLESKKGSRPVCRHPENGSIIIPQLRRSDPDLKPGQKIRLKVSHDVNLYWGKIITATPGATYLPQPTPEEAASEQDITIAMDTLAVSEYRMLNHPVVIGTEADGRFIYKWSNVFSLLGIPYNASEQYTREYLEEVYMKRLKPLHPDSLVGRSPAVQRSAAETRKLLEESLNKALTWIHVKIQEKCFGETGEFIEGKRCDNKHRKNQIHCTEHLEKFKEALLKMEEFYEQQAQASTNTATD